MKIKNLAITGLLVAGFAGYAQAQIRCDGSFQITRRGERIVTPYCEDAEVAAVAREYGMRVSAAAVRGNPSIKQRVCQFAGADLRIRDTCSGYRDEIQRRR